MKFHFIENTDERYSINENGEIHSHYRFQNNGKKRYRLLKCTIYECQRGIRASIIFKNEKKTKTVFPSTLMIKYFNLITPDNFHLYDLYHKDGNKLNFALSNIEYRIKLISDCNFYPQPFLVDNKIVSKICGQCGENISIDNFTLQTLDKKSKKRTYRNTCNLCRNKNNWERIKTNKSSKEKYLIQHKKWKESEKGKLYYAEYQKEESRFNVQNITDKYICDILRIQKKDLTPKLRELQKKKLVLRRAIFNN
jgi:hypothetical protein